MSSSPWEGLPTLGVGARLSVSRLLVSFASFEEASLLATAPPCLAKLHQPLDCAINPGFNNGPFALVEMARNRNHVVGKWHVAEVVQSFAQVAPYVNAGLWGSQCAFGLTPYKPQLIQFL